eukprot:g623.t1
MDSSFPVFSHAGGSAAAPQLQQQSSGSTSSRPQNIKQKILSSASLSQKSQRSSAASSRGGGGGGNSASNMLNFAAYAFLRDLIYRLTGKRVLLPSLGPLGGALSVFFGLSASFHLFDRKLGMTHDLGLAIKVAPVFCKAVRYFQGAATMTDVWQEAVAKHRDKTAIVFENKRLSFRDVERTVAQMAAWLYAKMKIGKDDCVALYLENRPEFVCWWLAITRIGAVVALLNYNLKTESLLHCLRAGNSKAVVCDCDTEQRLAEALRLEGAWGDEEGGAAARKDEGISVIYWGDKRPRHFSSEQKSAASLQQAKEPPSRTTAVHTVDYEDLQLVSICSGDLTDQFFKTHRRADQKFDSLFGYIYTSGTTGLPKAAKIPHLRMWAFGAMVSALGGITSSDTIYTCLPIFHSAGGGIGVVSMMITGATLVLSRKFSATKFWPEVRAHECTVVQYIGELATYLVNANAEEGGGGAEQGAGAGDSMKGGKAVILAKPKAASRSPPHRVRLAVGNGLRASVWREFQNGFDIPEILEFYGATEGNGAMANVIKKNSPSVGSVGRYGTVARKILGLKVVKFDMNADRPHRDPRNQNFCVECAAGEPGELLFPIKSYMPHTRFAGYTNESDSEKKLLRDVFRQGDLYFRTGDLLKRDALGNYFFVDRLGDTFRWKGENVSTTEVANVLQKIPAVLEANVYGVEVPGSENGRACLAALTLKSEDASAVTGEMLTREVLDVCQKKLPAYAIPLFIRILKEEVADEQRKLEEGGSPLPSTSPASGGGEGSSTSASRHTETLKQQKVEMRQQGCDPEKCAGDLLFWLTDNKYEPLDSATYRDSLPNAKL